LDRVDSKVLLPHIIEIRALAVQQPGYISGETFFHLDRPEECLVMSKWTSLEHWHRWTRDARRIELHQNIKEHLALKPSAIFTVWASGKVLLNRQDN
jgi:heme-degrading monooxygenase HmoA